MRYAWTIAAGLFALLTCVFVGAWIVTDRASVMRNVGEQTQSLARMISAHGDAAINDANLIISSVADLVAGWDFEDQRVGREILNRLRIGTTKSPQVSSAWILDGSGVSRLDTWEYPSKPYQATERVYWKEHIAGAANPVIASDPTPGIVSGQERFTYSEALRNPDGSLRAIIVVAIYSNAFDTLYKEVANWPQARAGLYTGRGAPLARLRVQAFASPAFVEQVTQKIATDASGAAVVADGDDVRILGWQRSAVYPGLYATASQTVAAALGDWEKRSFLLAGFAGTAILAFVLFAWMSARAADANHTAVLSNLAMREAHHRVKNSLQLMASMVGLQSRRAGDARTGAALEKIGHQIHAIADAHDLLQRTSSVGDIDICALLRQLCTSLQLGYAGTIRFHGGDGPHIDGNHAASIAVICNEIITNAMKHARNAVDVFCQVQDHVHRAKAEHGHLHNGVHHHVHNCPNGAMLAVIVADDGPGLPADFQIPQKHGFGLRAALLLAQGLDAALTAGNRRDEKGASFCLCVPIKRLNVRASAAHPKNSPADVARPSGGPPAQHRQPQAAHVREAPIDRVEI